MGDTLAHLQASIDGDSVYIQPTTTRVSQIEGDTTAGQSDSGKTEATGVAVILAAGCVAFGVLITPVLALAVCRLSHTMQLGGTIHQPQSRRPPCWSHSIWHKLTGDGLWRISERRQFYTLQLTWISQGKRGTLDWIQKYLTANSWTSCGRNPRQ